MSTEESEVAAADITKDVEPNYLDPNFILQNLGICSTERLYNQPPFTIRAKQRLAEIVSLQAVFYTMLCLKSFIGCDMPPSIVIIGTGTIGTAIIDLLTKCGCQPYMYIYSRSDVAAKQWRERGYKSHHIIGRLLRGVNADIFIFAFNLQSFPSVCRQIIDVVTPQSVCINTIFALNRKRIYRVLRINTVYRTYVEASVIARRLECELKELVEDARAHVATGEVKSVVQEFFAEGGVLSDLGDKKSGLTVGHQQQTGSENNNEDEHSGFHMNNDEDDDYDSDNEYLEIEALSAMEEACQLIARRSESNIVNIISLTEYFNSVRGMPHPLARREAIESVLGDILDENREPMPQLNPHIVPPSVKEKEDDESRPGTSKGSKSRPGSRGGNGSKPGSPNASGGMFGTAVNSRKGLPSGGPAHISTLSNIAGMAHHARNKVNSNKLHQPHGIHNSRSSGSGASPSPSAGDTAVNTDANSVANTGTNTPIRGLSPAQSPSASNKDLLDRLHQNQGKTLSKSAKKLLMGRAPSVPAFLVSKTSPLLNLQFPLTECILRMHKYVGIHFQKYFSRYILISDIPPPIKEHILSDVCAVAPEWPPEPVYFNNILDIYADRRKRNIPLYDESQIIAIYESDTMAELSAGNYGGRGDGTYSPAGPRGHSRGFDLLQQMDIDSDDDNRDLKEMAAPSLVEREAREREYKEIEEFVLGSGISKTSSPEPTPREAARRELEKEEQARLEQAKRDEDERLYLADQEERNRYAINVAKDIINREDRGSPTFSENDDMSPRATTTATTNT